MRIVIVFVRSVALPALSRVITLSRTRTKPLFLIDFLRRLRHERDWRPPFVSQGRTLTVRLPSPNPR